ncbi:RluA family pseudouridine synthase [Alteribacillus iranensis]|uniref:Pseudouridine synthase n=1 Tax=Alteribacillus iranensis TaxID=930128 RepID=A0A1I2A8U6_9BACI|nr:RluA family pseudouridine synthase [Alteribacillus iranensis]SFE40504.1 ribosomal large subunit pseudouridine synthase D [Alteribacillus iranensis]
MKQETWLVQQGEAGSRIDKFLAQKKEEWSRTVIQTWIKENRVQVNEKRIKSNYTLQEHDRIDVFPEEKKEIELLPEPIELDVRYEDNDVIVVNKPRGMVVHPAPGHHTGTLVNGLMHHCSTLSTLNGEWRPGIVHRLDKDTSGLLVAAKNDKAHEKLGLQLQERKVKRIYRAIVHGDLPHDYGTIDAPIGRDLRDRQKMAVTDKNSKDAVTYFKVLNRWENYTLLECQLLTGRMHQIRVHMAYIGYPVAGDPKYGRAKTLPINGQALHAYQLEFTHPSTDKEVQIEAELPRDMKVLIEDLEKKD